jgi:hypothetical protein
MPNLRNNKKIVAMLQQPHLAFSQKAQQRVFGAKKALYRQYALQAFFSYLLVTTPANGDHLPPLLPISTMERKANPLLMTSVYYVLAYWNHCLSKLYCTQ